MTTHAEQARQWVHIGSGLFALLLRFLTWRQAAVLALVAFAFNAFALPRVGGRRLYRPVDLARGFPLGILLYPLLVLALILVFPERLDIVAAAWAIMAFGDGAATLAGKRFSSRRLVWNREKTVGGTAAFFLSGSLAAAAFAWWTRPAVTPPPPLIYVVIAPVGAAFIAALVETIPVGLDDNISVPSAAAAVLWLGSLMTRGAATASLDLLLARVPAAVGINAVVAWLGFRAGTVTRSGAIGGALIGAVIYDCGGAAAWLLLFAAFFVASAASRLGLARKARLGIAEERGGRRGFANAFANCGVASLAAIVAVTTPYQPTALLAMVAALVAGGSDTVASEVGKAWGRATVLVTSARRVKPGTPGAMSPEGTAAGIVSALLLAGFAAVLDLIPAGSILAVAIGATAGALVESALAATLEGPGILNNDMLNFINTLVAAAVAMLLGT